MQHGTAGALLLFDVVHWINILSKTLIWSAYTCLCVCVRELKAELRSQPRLPCCFGSVGHTWFKYVPRASVCRFFCTTLSLCASLEFRLMQFWLCLRQTACAALHDVNLIKKSYSCRHLASGQREDFCFCGASLWVNIWKDVSKNSYTYPQLGPLNPYLGSSCAINLVSTNLKLFFYAFIIQQR